MYILTDGLNYGAARIIGEAVAQEKLRHRLGGLEEQEFDSREVGHITAIGVVSSDKLSYGQAIEEASGTKVRTFFVVSKYRFVVKIKIDLSARFSNSLTIFFLFFQGNNSEFTP